jgi:hypothetical protein
MSLPKAHDVIDRDFGPTPPVTLATRHKILASAHKLRGSVRAMHGLVLTDQRRSDWDKQARTKNR